MEEDVTIQSRGLGSHLRAQDHDGIKDPGGSGAGVACESVEDAATGVTVQSMTGPLQEDWKPDLDRALSSVLSSASPAPDDGFGDIRSYSPLALAFVGDGVFDLVIRTAVMARGNCPVKKLHRAKAGFVNARAQAQLARRMKPFLTAEEQEILRRGRNAHSATTAKNQTVADYRAATGLEALCGYLYLTGQMERLLSLIEAGLKGEGLQAREAEEA